MDDSCLKASHECGEEGYRRPRPDPQPTRLRKTKRAVIDDQMDERVDSIGLGSHDELANDQEPSGPSNGSAEKEAANRLTRGVEFGRGRGVRRFDQLVGDRG